MADKPKKLTPKEKEQYEAWYRQRLVDTSTEFLDITPKKKRKKPT